MNKLEKIKYQFHKNDDGELDLDLYGTYRMGLTKEEIKDYLRARANKLNIERLCKKFNEIAGCNTVTSTPDGKFLMYRWDVKRFADVLFGKSDYTYFD